MAGTVTFCSNTATIDWDSCYPITTDNTVWIDNTRWVGDISPHKPNQAEVHIGNIHINNIQKQEVKEMRGLFHVVVVEYKTDKLLEVGLYIAKDKETAKIKALAPFADAYDLDDLDAICNKLGDVRKKKEITKVQVVKDG